MKPTHFVLTAAMILFAMKGFGQTCGDIKIKKGTVLHYEQESAPPQIKTIEYFKKSKKEQEAEDAEFTLKLNNGTLKPTAGQFDISVQDVTSDENQVMQIVLGKTQWGKTILTRHYCTNGILTIAPEKDMDTATIGSTLITNIYGYKKFPLVLKMGDTLPDYQNMMFNSPYYFEIPIYVNHINTDMFGDTWLTRTQSTTGFSAKSYTTNKYANRQIIEEEEMVIDGVSYKAYLVHNELYSKVELKPSSQSAFIDALAKYQRKRVEKRVNKILGGGQNGVMAAVTLEWFIPTLGVIAKTEVYDATGRKLAMNKLTRINF